MPRKNSKHLTDPAIGKMGKAPKGKRVERFDAGQPGLSLRITDRGVKSWSVYYRLNNTHQRKTIGTWPETGIADARNEARKVKAQAKAGINPKPERKTEEAGNAAPGTFASVAEKYIALGMLVTGNRPRAGEPLRRKSELESIIRDEMIPAWHGRVWADLRARHAYETFFDPLLIAGQPQKAHKRHEILRRIGKWAKGRDMVDLNPFTDMEAPVSRKKRDRVLIAEETKACWKAWGLMGYPSGDFMKLALLTAQREAEVAGMAWDEIDLEAETWTIPGTRTKNSATMTVPLSAQALKIIKTLPRFTGEDSGDHCLTTTSGKRPISGFSKIKARADDLSGVTGWTIHDLRRTARTLLAASGVRQEIAERCMNHVSRDRLQQIYDRHEYGPEMRIAFDKLGQRVSHIVGPSSDNVVQLKAASV